jgi:hypothetical protein
MSVLFRTGGRASRSRQRRGREASRYLARLPSVGRRAAAANEKRAARLGGRAALKEMRRSWRASPRLCGQIPSVHPLRLGDTSSRPLAPPRASSALRALGLLPRPLDSRQRIFSAPDGGIVNLSNFRKRVWRPALAFAGLEYRSVYEMRHTFATLVLAAGDVECGVEVGGAVAEVVVGLARGHSRHQWQHRPLHAAP